jgi:hypothetical protein
MTSALMFEFLNQTIKKIDGPHKNTLDNLYLYRIITIDKASPSNYYAIIHISPKPIFLKARMEIIIRINSYPIQEVRSDKSDLIGTMFKTRENGKLVRHSIKKTIVVDSSTNPLNSIYINSEKKAVQIDPVEKMKKKGKKVGKKPEFQLARDRLFNSLGLKKGLHFYIKDHRTTEPVS